MSGASLPVVLLVEDSLDDVDFARRALASCPTGHRLEVVEGGEAALAWLAGRAAGERPALVLLDLNLAGMSGRELLDQIKRHRQWRTIPVVIFTTSAHPAEIEHCRQAGADDYRTKPDDFAGYRKMLHQIVEYHLDAVGAAGRVCV